MVETRKKSSTPPAASNNKEDGNRPSRHHQLKRSRTMSHDSSPLATTTSRTAVSTTSKKKKSSRQGDSTTTISAAVVAAKIKSENETSTTKDDNNNNHHHNEEKETPSPPATTGKTRNQQQTPSSTPRKSRGRSRSRSDLSASEAAETLDAKENTNKDVVKMEMETIATSTKNDKKETPSTTTSTRNTRHQQQTASSAKKKKRIPIRLNFSASDEAGTLDTKDTNMMQKEERAVNNEMETAATKDDKKEEEESPATARYTHHQHTSSSTKTAKRGRSRSQSDVSASEAIDKLDTKDDNAIKKEEVTEKPVKEAANENSEDAIPAASDKRSTRIGRKSGASATSTTEEEKNETTDDTRRPESRTTPTTRVRKSGSGAPVEGTSEEESKATKVNKDTSLTPDASNAHQQEQPDVDDTGDKEADNSTGELATKQRTQSRSRSKSALPALQTNNEEETEVNPPASNVEASPDTSHGDETKTSTSLPLTTKVVTISKTKEVKIADNIRKKKSPRNELTSFIPGYTAPLRLDSSSLNIQRPGLEALRKRALLTDKKTAAYVKGTLANHKQARGILASSAVSTVASSFKKGPKREVPNHAGDKWFGMVPTPLTDEVKRDLTVIRNRNYLDPKRFYKSSDKPSQFVQVGTVVEGNAEYSSARLTKKERRSNLTEELMADPSLADYTKRKYRTMQQEKDSKSQKQKRPNKRGKRQHF